MTRWYFSTEGTPLGSHDPATPIPAWFDAHLRTDYYVVHPGFPGVVMGGTSNDGAEVVYPPRPGVDFGWKDVIRIQLSVR